MTELLEDKILDCNHNPDFSYKIGKLKGIPVFNIPAIKTCPHRTKACEAYCYAKGGFFAMPWTKQLLDRNYEASKCDCFVPRMKAIIDYLIGPHKRNKVTRIRVHSSGDFYSLKYFEKWLDIIRCYPDITFIAYTRNRAINMLVIPENLILFYSVDHTTEAINPTAQRLAVVLDLYKHDAYTTANHLDEFEGGRVCLSERCDLCLYCFNKDSKNVYFFQRAKRHSIPLKEAEKMMDETGDTWANDQILLPMVEASEVS